MELESIFSAISKKKTETADAGLEEEVLSINCRKCDMAPDFRSPNCLKCIIYHISQQGNAGRIRLRTSRDMELFGPAAEILCELSVFYRSTALDIRKGDGRPCADCGNSCSKIMSIVWSGFPDPSFDSARGRLATFHPSDGKCSACIQKTYRALDQAELGINNLKKKISIESARTGGA